MFGYVRVDKGELKVKEFEAYRGMYCSLCRALSKRYGVLSRLILSYDATFLAIVRFSQSQLLPSFRPGHCPFNPAKRCNYCTNGEEAFDFVCAVAVLMFYYKVRDDLSDEGFFRRLLMMLLLPIAALWRKKAKKRFPAVDALLGQAMAQALTRLRMHPLTRSGSCSPLIPMIITVRFTASDMRSAGGSILQTQLTIFKKICVAADTMCLLVCMH